MQKNIPAVFPLDLPDRELADLGDALTREHQLRGGRTFPAPLMLSLRAVRLAEMLDDNTLGEIGMAVFRERVRRCLSGARILPAGTLSRKGLIPESPAGPRRITRIKRSR
ncbi:MAG: hypothetical protein IKM31_03615 [Oscillospiraceae bacterium]|nr:hypothetical protein [Oscillospiraceae bacterium]